MSPPTKTVTGLKVLLLLTIFPSLLVPLATAGTATAYNHCSTSVFCAIVKENGGAAVFQEVRAGGQLSTDIMSLPNNVGYTIMCKRINTEGAPVTQIEWTRNDSEGMVHFDLSIVKGAVFVNDGMTMYVNEGRTSQFPTCYGALCRAGENPCSYAYNGANDFVNGERTCSKNVSLQWHMCFVDPNLVLPPPGTGAKVE
jgi:hypothetical protein